MTSIRTQRLAAAAGAAFAALVAVSIALSTGGPSPGDSAAKINAYFGDAANRDKLTLAALLYGLAAVCLIGWVAGLRDRLREGGPQTAFAGRVLFGGGLVVVALECASVAALVGYPFALGFFDAARPDPQIALALQGVSYWLASLAGLVTAAMAAATGIAALRTGALPRWLARTSLVLAPLSIVSALMYLAPVTLLIWVLATSVALARRPRSAAVALGEPALAGR
jgi:hypothetical protein